MHSDIYIEHVAKGLLKFDLHVNPDADLDWDDLDTKHRYINRARFALSPPSVIYINDGSGYPDDLLRQNNQIRYFRRVNCSGTQLTDDDGAVIATFSDGVWTSTETKPRTFISYSVVAV